MFVSCRSTATTLDARKKYTFREAIFQGWAEDGGMIMPEKFPAIPLSTLQGWSKKKISYSECCYQIIRLFVPVEDIPDKALRHIITVDAFDSFGTSNIVKNKVLNIKTKIKTKIKTEAETETETEMETKDGSAAHHNAADHPQHNNTINILELWHGPTLAFKDLGMQVLCKLLQYYLDYNKEAPDVLNLLVGTSGDTGSSAIEAVKELPNVTITVLYPKGRGITLLQELQMTSVGEISNNGVKVIGIDGTSDDLDRPMEAIFNDVEFKKQHSIGSVNSVNICRVLVQIAHYIWAAVVVADDEDEDGDGKGKGKKNNDIDNNKNNENQNVKNIHFYVPTGAGGHITAGAMARRMLREMTTVRLNLHVATNSNDVFHRIIQCGTNNNGNNTSQAGETKTSTSGAVVSTLSPSMDIQVPYNLERLLWMSSMFNDTLDEETKIKKCIESAKLMKSFKETENIQLSAEMRDRLIGQCGIVGSSAHDDQVTKETISQVYNNSDDQKYVLDPHTAIGVHASMLNSNKEKDDIVFCMACAHPSKFPVAIEQALEGVVGFTGSNTGKGKEKWWWLSDQEHSSVQNLLELDRKNVKVTCEEYKFGTDWVNRLKEHFVAQTEEKGRPAEVFFRMARPESGRFTKLKKKVRFAAKRCEVQ